MYVVADPTLFLTTTIPAERPFSRVHTALPVPFFPLVTLELSDETSSKGLLVVDDRGLLARKMLSAVEKNFRQVGLVGGAQADMLDRDSLGHEERTGLEAIESLRRKGVQCPGTPLEV